MKLTVTFSTNGIKAVSRLHTIFGADRPVSWEGPSWSRNGCLLLRCWRTVGHSLLNSWHQGRAQHLSTLDHWLKGISEDLSADFRVDKSFHS
eukprot:m.188518 g.188518  ORF g.188518 m.188518 type:complete len:92 (+) comp39387_c0_seq3:224-499(+)